MADYQDIRGLRVKYLSANPTVTVAGEVWYNSTTGTLKSRLVSQAWSSGSSLATPRGGSAFGGTQTAGVLFGGRQVVPTSLATTEEYNGVGWSSGGAMTTARLNLAGFGTLTAAVGAGGSTTGSPATNTDACEEYGGTTWTAGGTISSRRYLKGCGILTAGLITGGYTTTTVNVTEEYDGTSWTGGGANTFTKYFITNSGTQTAALGYQGVPAHTATNSYDGTSWTAVPATMNTERAAGVGAGTQTAALTYGGYTPPSADSGATESYDGTTWTSSPASLAVARTALTGGGTTTASIAAGGGTVSSGGVTPGGATEEFNVSDNTTIAGTWASKSNMNTARRGICSVKNATADTALGALGYVPPNPPGGEGTAHAETFDGSSWTIITSVPSGRYFGGGFGTQTTAVIVGGYSTVPSAGQKDITNEWDGSSWSLGGTLPTGQSNFAADGCGTATAGLVAGGLPGPYTITAEYNGSSWTTVPGSLNTPRTGGASFGVQTAAMAATGDVPAGYPKDSESYDGTSWSSTNPTIYGGYGAAGAGTQTAGLHAGNAPPGGTTSQTWDGTNWSTNPSYTTARFEMGGTGSSTAALGFSGATSGPTVVTNATEEFTGPSTTANIQTLTTS